MSIDSATELRPRVLVSILNWNSAERTLACLRSLLASQADVRLVATICIIDNGSAPADWEALQAGAAGMPAALTRLATNIGFAGGHNVAIARAIDEGHDFIWLLNNDAIVEPETLGRLVAAMDHDPSCGALSPLVLASDAREIADFCGAVHDWGRLTSTRARDAAEWPALRDRAPHECWVAGTAALYRTRALAQVGPLCEALFAYFEDDDIGVRLARAGWHSAMCLEAVVLHGRTVDHAADRPAYYFYLMTRNAFHFHVAHTPPLHRRWLRYRLACRGFVAAHRLAARGQSEKSAACLLGVQDGLLGRWGRPELDRTVAWPIRVAARHYGHRFYERVERACAAA